MTELPFLLQTANRQHCNGRSAVVSTSLRHCAFLQQWAHVSEPLPACKSFLIVLIESYPHKPHKLVRLRPSCGHERPESSANKAPATVTHTCLLGLPTTRQPTVWRSHARKTWTPSGKGRRHHQGSLRRRHGERVTCPLLQIPGNDRNDLLIHPPTPLQLLSRATAPQNNAASGHATSLRRLQWHRMHGLHRMASALPGKRL